MYFVSNRYKPTGKKQVRLVFQYLNLVTKLTPNRTFIGYFVCLFLEYGRGEGVISGSI